MYKNFFIFSLVILLSSCISLPLYVSIAENEFDKETIYSGYNAESNLRWLITNDDKNIYIRIDTDNNITIKKIINTGVKVYIDTLLKKKKDIYVNYPIFENNQLSESDKKRNNLELLLQKTSNTIKFYKNKKIYIHNTLDKNSGFKGNIEITSKGSLQYFLQIPLNKIKSTIINDLSMGIYIEGFDIDLPSNNNMSTIDMKTNQHREGRHNRTKTTTVVQPDLAKDISIWFKVNLAK